MTDSTPYTVPEQPGRWRAIVLATLVHLALLALLWIGVRWQSETPVTIEAEVWSLQPQEAAPRPQPAEPQPQLQPQPVAKEQPKPLPEPPVEQPVAKPALPDPDIVLEQEKEKKRKLDEERKRAEQQLALEQEKKRKAMEEKQRLEKQLALEQEKKRKEQEEKKRLEEEQLAKKKQVEEQRVAQEKAEAAKKLAAEKKRKQEEAAHEQLMAKIREEDMRRMTGGLAGTGGSGDAAKSQGGRANAGYIQKIAAKIKSNTVFNVPDSLTGNPAVEYAIELLPDGTLRGAPRKLKSSGVPGFDEAVFRAIDRAQPFPRDEKTGAVPSSLTVSHRPKDQ